MNLVKKKINKIIYSFSCLRKKTKKREKEKMQTKTMLFVPHFPIFFKYFP